MFGLFKRTERRQADYSDAIVRAIIASAQGGSDISDYRDTAAAQVAAATVARALASAKIEGVPVQRTGLSGDVLHDIGSALILEGEHVAVIEVSPEGVVTLTPAAGHDIDGGPDPAGWRYRVTLGGPTRSREVTLPAEAIFHPRINTTAQAPHRGRSPISVARNTARLASGLERLLADESEASSGHVLPVPDATPEDALTDIRADLKKLRGRTATVPSMSGNWEGSRAAAPADWKPQRLGFDPPDIARSLRDSVFFQVLALAGIPPAMLDKGEAAGKREALRQFLHATLQPLARVIEAEAKAKLMASLRFDFTELHASDVQGRARAFQSMVTGGMDLDKAAALSGLLVAEETE